MTKKLNVEAISQELAGSVFFPQRTTTPASETTEEKPAAEKNSVAKDSDNEGVPLPVPPVVPRGVPPTVPLIPKVKRPIKQRQPFDIFEDQYQTLKSVADAEKDFVNGRGLSQMVREALDNYIRDHINPKK